MYYTAIFANQVDAKRLMYTLNNRGTPFPKLFLDVQETVWFHFSICRGPESS